MYTFQCEQIAEAVLFLFYLMSDIIVYVGLRNRSLFLVCLLVWVLGCIYIYFLCMMNFSFLLRIFLHLISFEIGKKQDMNHIVLRGTTAVMDPIS